MPHPDGPPSASLLRRNLDRVAARLRAASESAGRDPSEVRLIAVTKSVGTETALALAGLGQVDLGESRLPALEEKAAAFAARDVPVRWHFVGHLQRNKARRVARLAHAIHAVDSAELLRALARIAAEEGAAPALYLQVKIADEPAKHGLRPAELAAVVEEARALRLPLAGLMTMAPLVSEAEVGPSARAAFQGLAALAGTLPPDAFLEGRPRLSMGMSGDLEQAVAAGAHDVRIGTALFEPAEVGG